MVQSIKDFAEGIRKGFAIPIECGACHKRVLHLARGFDGHIAGAPAIEDLRWRRCWDGKPASYVR